MADALISPMVAVTMLATTVGLATYSVHKVQNEMDNKKIPLMGVMGAFIFAAQMINFTIPGTGSSGHIGGGMLLTILLGPYAGFLTMASILLIQALFFADGGLLAYGCNVFNLGFFACFIAYPMIYKYLTRKAVTPRRILLASLISVVVALQLGAFSVVLETFFSGQTELPFSTFVLMMQPMHLAIGLVEGLVTAAIVTFIWQARPEIINRATTDNSLGNPPITKVVIGLAIAVILVGGGLSWFASDKPDGLEWSILQAYGSPELAATDAIYQKVAAIQKQTAFLPDYNFKADASRSKANTKGQQAWPAINAGTSVSGLLGGVLTLILLAATGVLIHLVKIRKKRLPA